MKTEKSIYFSGINGLRFFAALAVIITHVELLKGVFGFNSYWKNPVIFNLGGLGVCFFFVLSGFLITYLLLVEKAKTKEIKIKKFYIRRILRIWPLYYLILIIGFFVLPKFDAIQIHYLQGDFTNHFNVNLILYLLIFPNLAFSLYTAVPHIGQAWSIGVEEQFYLVWPWVISKTKNVVKTLVLIIVALILIKISVLLIGKLIPGTTWYVPLKNFVAMSKFECMALGGIGAYYLFTKDKKLSFIYNKYVMTIAIIMIPILIYFTPDRIQDGIHIIYSALFLIIILNVSNNSVKINLETKSLNYLGKISYGIYMYHFMIIPIVLYFCKKYLMGSSEILLNIIIYMLSVGLTVLISSISFELFENYFIKLKSKYSPVKSGTKD